MATKSSPSQESVGANPPRSHESRPSSPRIPDGDVTSPRSGHLIPEEYPNSAAGIAGTFITLAK